MDGGGCCFQAPGLLGAVIDFARWTLPETLLRAAEELNRYLSRDRVASGQAPRSAERTLRDLTSDVVNRQAVLTAGGRWFWASRTG